MSDWQKWHKFYEENEENKEHINNMFELVYEYGRANGLKMANDDRAEEFVSAIAKYLEESKK